MTSAKSSLHRTNHRMLNPQVQMMKHRLWIVAVTVVSAVAYYLIGGLLYLSRSRQDLERLLPNVGIIGGENASLWTMADYVRHFYGFCSLACLPVILLAVLMALEGYSYMHRTQTVDFYESQPLKRSSRFFRIYWNGFRIFLCVWTPATLVGIAIGALYGGMAAPALVEILIEYVRLCFLFFGVYNISILAAAISKNTIVSVLMTAILLCIEAGYREFMEILKQTYFTTYYFYDGLTAYRKAKIWWTSPIANYFSGRSVAAELQRTTVVDWKMLGSCFKGLWYTDVANLVIGLVFLALAYVAFCNRKSESVGQGLVYRWMEGVTKLVVAIPLGAITGMIMDMNFDEIYKRIGVLTVVMIILIVVCFCMITEAICNGNIRACLKRAWQMPLAVVLSFAFFLSFRMDAFGYDRYVPKESEIADVVFFDSNYQQYYTDYDAIYPYPRSMLRGYIAGDLYHENLLEQNMHLTDVDAAIKIAKIGMKERSERLRREDYNFSYSAVIIFHLKNGDIVARNIALPEDVDEELMNRLIGCDEYRNAVYQIDAIRDAAAIDVNRLCVQYDYGMNRLELPRKETVINELLDAYAKDLRTMNFSKLKHQAPIGYIYAYTENEYSLNLNYPVYSDFTNTIEYLTSQECYHSSQIPIELLTEVNLYGGFQRNDSYYSGDLYYTEPDKMEAIAKKAHLSCDHDWTYYGQDVYVSISLYGDYEDEFYDISNAASYAIAVEDVPEGILSDFTEEQW